MELEPKKNKEKCPKLYTKPDTEKGWNIIKEAVNKAASLFKKETKTREKPWLEVYADDIIGYYQSGFMRGKFTTFPIFSVRKLLEKYYDYGRELHLCFVDFEHAYDSILRRKLWAALEEFGITTKLIQLIKECNTGTKRRVKFANKLSKSFEVRTGLRQGDALFPVLFNLALEKVIRSLPTKQNMEILEQKTILAYEDDIVIVGSSRIDVEVRTAGLIKAAEPIILKVNHEKTKYLVVSREERGLDDMLVDRYVFQQVTDFKYLGANINNMHNEIKLRIASGNIPYIMHLRNGLNQNYCPGSQKNIYIPVF
ncbi:hypothetical protein QTP88_014932 [Uroleucon formosanum]